MVSYFLIKIMQKEDQVYIEMNKEQTQTNEDTHV